VRWLALEAVLDVAPKIRPFEKWTNVLEAVEKFSPYLSCVGYAGSADRGPFLERELAHQDGLRICPIGEMQRPPLSWRNGGIDLADLLN
jgi:hypothetical protein